MVLVLVLVLVLVFAALNVAEFQYWGRCIPRLLPARASSCTVSYHSHLAKQNELKKFCVVWGHFFLSDASVRITFPSGKLTQHFPLNPQGWDTLGRLRYRRVGTSLRDAPASSNRTLLLNFLI